MASYEANADYEEMDNEPIRLHPGDEISTGPIDKAWPGWVWAENRRGHKGYVPLEILESRGDGRYIAKDSYDPTVLTIKRGDQLESLKQIHGWHWCRDETGAQGWVAGYLLRPCEPG
ncbi:MAG: SH3 domain-containing protein [Verrucomicrobiota bacterium]